MTILTNDQLNDIAGQIGNDFLTNHENFCTENGLNPHQSTVLGMSIGNAYGYIRGTINGYGNADAGTRDILNQLNEAFEKLLKVGEEAEQRRKEVQNGAS